MAEDQDPSQKTEEPTQRRLEEARRKGQVASSREVNHVLLLAAGALLLGPFAPGLAEGVAASLRPFLEQPHRIATDPAALGQALLQALSLVGLTLLVPVLLLLAAAVAGGLVQIGPLFTAEPVKPKLERISPIKGIRRLFSLRSLIEFAKSLLKIALVGALGVALLWPSWPEIAEISRLETAGVLAYARDLALRLLVAAAALMAVIALLDVAYQRHEHRKQLRMSRRDLREELKQSEGDPMIKARLRQLRMERARRRMMAEVPKATVVVTNPTHFAVALRYDSVAMAAPKVVAKGADDLALRIRALALEHAVPVVENPPLARALYETVELEKEIPPIHYRAVAEIIGYVMSLNSSRS